MKNFNMYIFENNGFKHVGVVILNEDASTDECVNILNHCGIAPACNKSMCHNCENKCDENDKGE